MALKGVKKGNDFEQKAADFLGLERRHLRGILDRGDLVHKEWTLECFAPGRDKPLNMSQKMTEAQQEAVNAGTSKYATIIRRTGYPIDEAYFTIPLWMARALFFPEAMVEASNLEDEWELRKPKSRFRRSTGRTKKGSSA